MRPYFGCIKNLVNIHYNPGIWLTHNSELLSKCTMQFELTLNFDYIDTTVRLKG